MLLKHPFSLYIKKALNLIKPAELYPSPDFLEHVAMWELEVDPAAGPRLGRSFNATIWGNPR